MGGVLVAPEIHHQDTKSPRRHRNEERGGEAFFYDISTVDISWLAL
jgi:hypothetical protein